MCKNFEAVVLSCKIKDKTTMREDNMKKGCKSTLEYEYLEEWVRLKPQEFIQEILEKEVGELITGLYFVRFQIGDFELALRALLRMHFLLSGYIKNI